MSPYVVALSFPVVFLGELPDKTMFANLLMATRGRPWHVWLGAAAAFVVHVAIAVSVGAALLALVPRRAVDAVVAMAFGASAVYALLSARSAHDEGGKRPVSGRNVVLGAFVVIFVAEWGDLTQILIANLAARYGHPLSVGVGSLAALWIVAGIAVTSGATLLRFVSMRRARQLTAIVLLALCAYAAWSSAH